MLKHRCSHDLAHNDTHHRPPPWASPSNADTVSLPNEDFKVVVDGLQHQSQVTQYHKTSAAQAEVRTGQHVCASEVRQYRKAQVLDKTAPAGNLEHSLASLRFSQPRTPTQGIQSRPPQKSPNHRVAQRHIRRGVERHRASSAPSSNITAHPAAPVVPLHQCSPRSYRRRNLRRNLRNHYLRIPNPHRSRQILPSTCQLPPLSHRNGRAPQTRRPRPPSRPRR